MTPQRTSILGLLLVAAIAGCAADASEDGELREGLMFGLEDADVVQIHAGYLGEEDITLTTDRLTAPFDCTLYDNLCDQIGREAAIEFTAEVVDLALEGATPEEIDAFNDDFLMRAMDEYEPEESDTVLRASGSWETDTSGNVRLRARNGITTPVIGSRQAWTEARTQRRNAFGAWGSRRATEICVNTGTNTQTSSFCGWNVPCSTSTFESFNPSQTCRSDASSHKSRTYHGRHNGYDQHGLWGTYTITARGSATAEINGSNLSEGVNSFTRVY